MCHVSGTPYFPAAEPFLICVLASSQIQNVVLKILAQFSEVAWAMAQEDFFFFFFVGDLLPGSRDYRSYSLLLEEFMSLRSGVPLSLPYLHGSSVLLIQSFKS